MDGTHSSNTSSLYWIFFLVLIGMTVWMWYQQSRQQKGRRQLQQSLSPGDRVVTVGGLIGTVDQVKDTQVVLKLSDNVKVRVLKSAIGSKYQDEA